MVRAMKYLLIAVLALCAFGCKKDEEAPVADASVDVDVGAAVEVAQEVTAAAADATVTTAAEDVTVAVD